MGFGGGDWPTPSGRHPWDRGSDNRWRGHGVLHLHRPGDPYAVWVFWQGPDRQCPGWYLNIQEPLRRTAIGIDTLDHVLDVVVARDGSWRFKDLDELDECVVLGRYTTEEAAAIRAEGESLGRMVDAGDAWWSTSWMDWRPPAGFTTPPRLPSGWDVP